MEYYSAPPKNNECESVELRWMNLKSVIHGMKSEREKQTSHINTHMGSRKMVIDEPTCRAGTDNRLVDTVGEEEGGTNRESSTDIYTLQCVNRASGKLLYNTGSPALWGGETLE